MDEADRAAALCHCADVGLGDRMIAAEDDRKRARLDHLRDRGLDCFVRASGIGGNDRGIAEIDHLESREGIDAHLEGRPRRAAGRPDCAGAVTRSRPVRDQVVRRRADDGHIRAGQLSGIFGEGLTPVGEQAGVVGFLAVLCPALLRVDHRPILPRRGNVAAWPDSTT
jgi:hypothetical protein